MDEYNEVPQSNRFRVAIFGSARITEESPEYQTVFNLAKLMASAGMELVTGGGPGLMEAASNGFYEGKKDTSLLSIGLNIKLPREQRFAAHLDVKKQFDRFSERLDSFVALSNAFVVMPGGIGTILELFYTWQLAQVKHISDKPIILLGDMWIGLLKWLIEWPLTNNLLEKEDIEMMYLTRSSEEAFVVLEESRKHYEEGDKEFCRTYQEYRLK